MSRGGPQGLGGALRASWVSLGPMGVSLGPMDIPGSHGCPWVPWVVSQTHSESHRCSPEDPWMVPRVSRGCPPRGLAVPRASCEGPRGPGDVLIASVDNSGVSQMFPRASCGHP